jgi:glycerate dehydrogenase
LLDGGLDWGEVAALGKLVSYPRTPTSEIVRRASGAAVVLTNKTPLSAETIAALPTLRFIGVLATGHNVVDSTAARARGIPVSNVPAYGTDSVAQHVFALILELTNRVGLHSDAVARGHWTASAEWCAPCAQVTELGNLQLGIIGRGRIAQRVAEIGRVFGLQVKLASPSLPAGGGNLSPLDEVVADSDILTMHCQLTPQTAGMVNSAFLHRMKKGAFLINTARGALVNEADLATALNDGAIAGAAVDVLSSEPPPADHPFCRLPNCIVTPHIAWMGARARRRLIDITAQNIRAFLAGKPTNVVNA